MKYLSRALAIAALLTAGSVYAHMDERLSDKEFKKCCEHLEEEFAKINQEIDSNKDLRPVLHKIARMLEHTKMKVMHIKHHMQQCPCMHNDMGKCNHEKCEKSCNEKTCKMRGHGKKNRKSAE